MTLIVSVLSESWAMQASDRRFTISGGEEHVDDSNKAIFVAERLNFAFTGRVDVSGEPADEWFQRQLSRRLAADYEVQSALEEIAEMLTQYFRALPETDGNRGLAFVGSGWTPGTFAERRPLFTWLSNIHGSEGDQLGETQDQFAVGERVLGAGRGYDLQIAGMQPGPNVLEQFHREIRSGVEESDEPERVGRLIVDFVRRAAASNSRIGKGVMLNNLPRAPGPPTGEIFLVGKVPDLEVRTFTYIPENGYEGRYLGPLVVGSGGIAMGNFQAFGTGFPNSGAGMSYSPPGSPLSPKTAIGQSSRPFRIGRNDPCWCESGKKYKRCHGR
jgi:hypothetical protein